MVLFSLTEAPIAKSTVDKMQGKIPEGEVGIHRVVGLSHCIQAGRQSLPDIFTETLLCNSVIVNTVQYRVLLSLKGSTYA